MIKILKCFIHWGFLTALVEAEVILSLSFLLNGYVQNSTLQLQIFTIILFGYEGI